MPLVGTMCPELPGCALQLLEGPTYACGALLGCETIRAGWRRSGDGSAGGAPLCRASGLCA